MNSEIRQYNENLEMTYTEICVHLMSIFQKHLQQAEAKVWHGHPVWFIDGNPVAGYSKVKDAVRVLFWSGQSFDEDILKAEGKFKAAEIRYQKLSEINSADLKRCLKKSVEIQWDYKNLIKRKGVLEPLVGISK